MRKMHLSFRELQDLDPQERRERSRDANLLLSYEQVASELDLSYSTVLRRVKNGQMRAIHLENRAGIHADDVSAYKRAREASAWLGQEWTEDS
jgi:excisionase family DNA binding protein